MYVDNYAKAYQYAKQKGVFYGSFLGCNFDERSCTHCRSCTPVPHLTSDGYISACDMALFGENANHMDVFIYGKWDATSNSIVFNDEKMRYLQSRTVKNMPQCTGCSVFDNCAGYCLGEVVNETGNIFGQKSYICEAIRLLSKIVDMNEGCYPHLHP
jgi:radical SAM protein with 4Fe4S-binding SPASM domain